MVESSLTSEKLIVASNGGCDPEIPERNRVVSLCVFQILQLNIIRKLILGRNYEKGF
jgi:hypothetical protein